jgi:outer membrane protein TolC
MKTPHRAADVGRARWLALALSALLQGGCITVGPSYVKPVSPVSETWQSQLGNAPSAEQTDPRTLASWWAVLDDPQATDLIERAVAANLDLKQAVSRVREARARRGAAQADLLPTIEAGGSATQARSKDALGGESTSDMYEVSLDAGWELDLFGGTRRSVEAYRADLQASEEDLRDVLASVLAEVALSYVDVRTYQARLAVAESGRSTS